MHAGIIFLAVIIGSVLFHIFTPWWWTDIASNWGAMDDTINLTFWIGGGRIYFSLFVYGLLHPKVFL